MLRIDPASSEPPFAQLCAQITEQVGRGALRPGDRLPTVRRLAGDLAIAPNTVARAYRELEADGILEARGRAGTFVARTGAKAAPDAAGGEAGAGSGTARDAADAYVRTVRALGLAPSEALALVRQAFQG